MAKRVAGICYIKLDGEQLTVEGSVECPVNEFNREAVMGLSGLAGFKETATEQYIKVAAIFESGFPLTTVRDNVDMTVTAELANGKVYTLSGAFLSGENSVKGDEGKVDLTFTGKKGVWQ
jgi:hypothetical protein